MIRRGGWGGEIKVPHDEKRVKKNHLKVMSGRLPQSKLPTAITSNASHGALRCPGYAIHRAALLIDARLHPVSRNAARRAVLHRIGRENTPNIVTVGLQGQTPGPVRSPHHVLRDAVLSIRGAPGSVLPLRLCPFPVPAMMPPPMAVILIPTTSMAMGTTMAASAKPPVTIMALLHPSKVRGGGEKGRIPHSRDTLASYCEFLYNSIFIGRVSYGIHIGVVPFPP
jgi:hypothetical protein